MARGEDIYEGDILKDESNMNAEVNYSMGAFYADFGEGFDLQYFGDGVNETSVIIGNIHDN